MDARRRGRPSGLVNRVVPDDELMPEVLCVARKIASYPPTGVQFQKELINQKWLRTDLEKAMHNGILYSIPAHTICEAKQLVKEAIERRKKAKAERATRE